MKKLFCITTSLASLFIAAASVNGEEVSQLEAEARELVGQYMDRLKPQLKQALTEGGANRAIEVCASEAPKISDSLSASSGWQVRRVSLKSRNASRAQPDKWERSVLEDFDRRQAAGESPPSLNHGAVTGSRYRYMQAQGTEGVCLTCHGEQLSQPVLETLQQYYPDDQATGYQLGHVRGAISVSKPL